MTSLTLPSIALSSVIATSCRIAMPSRRSFSISFTRLRLCFAFQRSALFFGSVNMFLHSFRLFYPVVFLNRNPEPLSAWKPGADRHTQPAVHRSSMAFTLGCAWQYVKCGGKMT